MFRYFQKMFRESDAFAVLIGAVAIVYWVTSFLGTMALFAGHLSTGEGNETVLSVVFLLPAIIAVAYACANGLYIALSRYITDGEISPSWYYENPVLGMLYLSTITLIPSLLLFTVLCQPSLLMPVVFAVVICGIVWGVLRLARFVYRINTRLAGHISDKAAHK